MLQSSNNQTVVADDYDDLDCSDDENDKKDDKKFNFERKSGLSQTIGELSEEFPLCTRGSTNLLFQPTCFVP